MKTEQDSFSKEPLITVEQFSFSYASNQDPILSDLNFTLHKNEVTLLMGASGSGKSTISLCLNGLYPEAVEGEATGHITFKGKNIKEFASGTINQQIGIVFQDPETQFCMINVEDELAFTLENCHTPPAQMSKRITEVLRLVGMEEYKNHLLHELSGGEKQKIALAAVLLLEPEVIILDEATVNLDPASTEEFIQFITSIQKERGLSLLIIDHQADDWLDMTNRVLLLNKEGRLIADNHPNILFTKKKALLRSEKVFLPKSYDDRPFLTWSPLSVVSKAVLNLENITFKRKNKTILNGVNMEILGGEFVSIVGANGAGKSTLLEIMAGLLHPDHGQVYLQEKALQHIQENELRKRMGFVFQNPEHQFITDTVYDEITFGMKLHPYPEKVMQQSATTLLEQFQLEEHKYHHPFALSGGQKRRLSVATALDETPDILLFDEPTFGQDAQTTKRLMEMMLEMKEKGIAIVFVTHDMDLASFSDKIVVLHHGRMAFSGIPDDLWKQDTLLDEARLRLPYHMRSRQLGEVL